jgi:hypothetical protein
VPGACNALTCGLLSAPGGVLVQDSNMRHTLRSANLNRDGSRWLLAALVGIVGNTTFFALARVEADGL